MTFALALACTLCFAQTGNWRQMHKVKSKETIYGIAKEYGITVDELTKANPGMEAPGYTLKKGDYIFIPYATADANVSGERANQSATVPAGALKVGVVLPLHNVDATAAAWLNIIVDCLWPARTSSARASLWQ